MKPPTNPYLRRMASLTGVSVGNEAVQHFVASSRGVEESLDCLARRFGVSRIIEQSLPFEGGLFRLSTGELVIKLNSQSSFVRKRFTLAHEIGHLLLQTVPAFRSSRTTDVALERTCDMIAAELLMPTNEVKDYVRGLGEPSPEKLRAIASKFCVSTQSAAIRVRSDFSLWKCSIGMWEISPRVEALWFVGKRAWRAVEPDTYCLERALASSFSIRTRDLWPHGACTETVWLSLLKVGSSQVLGLIDSVS